jgi:UDP-glucose 4-epimerase
MSNPVCVVLGGTGLLGKCLSRRLAEAGWSVRSVSRSGLPAGPREEWWGHVEWLSAAIGTDLCASALRGADVVFHLASTTVPSASNIAYDIESNVLASIRTLEAAASLNIPRLVFASSGGTIYGVAERIPILETHPTNPICSYGIHKLAVEKYLHLFRSRKRLDSICLRIANHYGEEQDLSKPLGAVAHFAARAAKGLPIEIWGDGSVTRDYVHVDDVADAFIRAASYRGRETLMNVGTGRGVSLNQLVQFIQKGLASPVAVDYKPARSFDVAENVLDIQRARHELGWEPKVSLESGIQRMILKAQQDQRNRPTELLVL